MLRWSLLSHPRWPRVATSALAAAFFPIVIAGGGRTVRADAHLPAADSLIVSGAWLAARLTEPRLVILHVDGPKVAYDAAHIPGARYIALDDFTAPEPHHGEGLSTELPPQGRITQTLAALGVSDDSRIVIYGPGATITARFFLTLEWLGLGDRTSMLDGGLGAWKADGRPLDARRPPTTRGRLTTHVKDGIVVSLEWLRANQQRPGTLVLDARNRQFYTGEAGSGMHMPRPGHIPGAHNLTYADLLTNDGRWRPRAELAQRFRDAGAAQGNLVVTYCHVGQQGSLLWLAARMLGFDARLYDGSFEEWSGRDDLPVHRSAGRSGGPTEPVGAQ